MTDVAHARTTDPETSHEAAAGVQITRNCMAVLTFINTHMPEPFTDKQLVAAYQQRAAAGEYRPQSESGIRSRRKELADSDLIRYCGRTRASGRAEMIWERIEVAA